MERDAAAGAPTGPSLPSPLTGDAQRGERIFAARAAQCHRIVDPTQTNNYVFHSLGPNLFGVVNRPIATVDTSTQDGTTKGYAYSPAAMGRRGDLLWTVAALDCFLENPRKFLPGTTMMFVGLKKAQDRADVIAYMQQMGGK